MKFPPLPIDYYLPEVNAEPKPFAEISIGAEAWKYKGELEMWEQNVEQTIAQNFPGKKFRMEWRRQPVFILQQYGDRILAFIEIQ